MSGPPPTEPRGATGAGAARGLASLASEVTECRRCPRLVRWREEVARRKRRAFADEEYWGRPVPGFGDPGAWLLIVGLAPAAHGANRTGRMFTGDRSGEWLYRALHRAGLATRPESRNREDGLRLEGAYVTAAVRCAPPANRPTRRERETCRPFLDRELDLLESVQVVVTLGALAWSQTLRVLRERGVDLPSPLPGFAHGAEVFLGPRSLLASYHPSQQNTFTRRLTEAMFDAIWERALELRGASRVGGSGR